GLAARDARLPAALMAAGLKPGRAVLMVRPELIAPLAAGEVADFSIQATVTEIFSKGGTVQYRAQLADGAPLVFELAASSSRPAKLGQHVQLGFPKRDIYLFQANASQASTRQGGAV